MSNRQQGIGVNTDRGAEEEPSASWEAVEAYRNLTKERFRTRLSQLSLETQSKRNTFRLLSNVERVSAFSY